jgi:hypothetical protein
MYVMLIKEIVTLICITVCSKWQEDTCKLLTILPSLIFKMRFSVALFRWSDLPAC